MVVLAEKKKKTTTKKVSYSLDINVSNEFNKVAKAKGYNKSRTVNNLIKNFLENEANIIKG